MYAYQYEIAKSMVEGRLEQVKKSSVKRKGDSRFHKKNKRKALFGAISNLLCGEEI
ncbi:hypothetical protein [Virgibacillus sp. YIM 98842]|uniref:hypothetical protein n=1 Tax=Virgibacillus sp. YIM 98842 TaxID=2663533 RepID=UPI0013DB0620|nr:hypothetical protein [Virgibacillus sp. YIM 98842]